MSIGIRMLFISLTKSVIFGTISMFENQLNVNIHFRRIGITLSITNKEADITSRKLYHHRLGIIIPKII